jgi:PAS domain S-box-containing protein
MAERFALLAQAATEYAIFTLDTDGFITSWNPGAERLKGYTRDEIVGQHFSLFYPAEDVERAKPEHLLAIAVAEGSVEDEGWRVRKDGSQFWADVVITALRGPHGDLRGFGKVTKDLTDRKRNEDSLRAVLEREREVAAGLRAMDKTKDEILAVVAHDLRGPLAVLDGLLEVLDEGWDALSSDEKRDAIRRMSGSTARLRSLVDDVMDVTRIDTGDLFFEITAFDADALAAGAVLDIAGLGANRIHVEPSATGAATAWGDERRAWQVLANLLSNALKFSPPDSPVQLRVIDTSAGEVRFEVEDCGPGVSIEDQKRIFEKFSRAAGASLRAEGTGLGLYIARSLADGQGGRIQLDSEVGKGSTFTFVLPKAGGESRLGGGKADEREEAGPTLRAVDDPPPADARAMRRGHRRRSIARAGARRRSR